ncbi:hypothetical protein K493DRAFT_341291 [Basidiobolus meristosporus CBS 931.73]|uniref:Periplasmic binding protein-like II n=1 Tax=Basidiobolus meristosporus CBS 931.73 TaxID=1314790 RepID=A0A1Y1XSH0_9FUNG|nr:hypothetical protein K493DRAFT_341291 [Basidiobolus meristosporus CBS 931.73]|eukprot:ORX88446.1 hypothetical protein K493DRAFT_341291 [Basidiobolus meristosporus CBS 931.73]
MRCFSICTLTFLGLTAVSCEVLTSNIVDPSFTVENYDPATDYFPDKVTFNNATKSRIEYRMNWKYVQLSSIHKYILYQRGTPQPERISQYDEFFEIPLNRVEVVNSTAVSYLDMLGLGERIVSAEPQYLTSPCIANSNSGVNVDALFSPDRYIVGNKTIHITEDPWYSPLVRSDLLKIYSVFFNLEKTANKITREIEDNYNCVKSEVGSMKAKTMPKIAWIYRSDYYKYHGSDVYYVYSTTSYLGSLMQDSGAQLIEFDEDNGALAHGYKNLNEFLDVIKDADIVVEISDFIHQNITYPTVDEVLQLYNLSVADTQYKFISNKAVYRVDRIQTKGGDVDWYFNAVVMADAALQDTVNMAHHDFKSNYTFHWMRSLFDDEKLDGPKHSTCIDPKAPLANVAYKCDARI